MNRLSVTCDQVFEILTSGPFPRCDSGLGSGADWHDANCEVERHLAACHDCRMLAEALRPAVRLIHEACAEDDASLPAYRGILPAAGSAPSALPTVVERRARLPWGNERRRDAAWHCLTALVLGFAAFAAFRLIEENSAKAPPWKDTTQSPSAAGERYSPSANGLRQLVAMGLPMACLIADGDERPTTRTKNVTRHSSMAALAGPSDAVSSVVASSATAGSAATESARFGCCMGCHSPANRSRPAVDSLAALMSSCVACHE